MISPFSGISTARYNRRGPSWTPISESGTKKIDSLKSQAEYYSKFSLLALVRLLIIIFNEIVWLLDIYVFLVKINHWS